MKPDRRLTHSEIQRAFMTPQGDVNPILTLEEVSRLFRVSTKTLYAWISKGRLDGAFRKRGKRHLFWRDRVADILFNGANWNG